MSKDADADKGHLVIVDAYTGFLEHLTDDPREIRAAAALGLPVEDIANRLGVRVTVLDWSEWIRAEASTTSFARWVTYPATKPVDHLLTGDTMPDHGVAGIDRQAIPCINPDDGTPIAGRLSPLSNGLLAESDPLFLLSYALNAFIGKLHDRAPIDAILFPHFGGLGYVAQMSRATGAGLGDIPMGVVVTGTSLDRQQANGEGLWRRSAITRRQMEDLSLGLADLALCFGSRGEARARKDGLERAVALLPRRIEGEVLEDIAAERDAGPSGGPVRFVLDEPMQGAAGSLMALDAVRILHQRGERLSRPLECSGRNMMFPPNLPRDFHGYWSGRGWAKALVEDGLWRWDADDPAHLPGSKVRIYPSQFEHLPDIWSELATGSAVLLSPEAAEGLAPGENIPAELMMTEPITLASLADDLLRIDALAPDALDEARHALCEAVLRAHGQENRERVLRGGLDKLGALLRGALQRPRLGQVALGLLDRRIEGAPVVPQSIGEHAAPDKPTLAVAVACYEMGTLVVETVESVWASTILPDELLLIDDGSRDGKTLASIDKLVEKANATGLPLTLIRQSNQGLAGARNRALAETNAAYISFLDGDDMIGPDFYRLALDILQGNPELGGVAAWSETFGDGVPTGFWNAPQPELPMLLAENTVFVPCMSPVKLLRDLGGYDTRQRYNYEDWELAIRLLEAGRPIVTIPRYLQHYRVREDSLLRTMSDVQNQVMREELFRNHRPLIEKFGPELSAQIEHRLMRSLSRQSEGLAGASTYDVVKLLRSRTTLRLAGSIQTLGQRAQDYTRKGRQRP